MEVSNKGKHFVLVHGMCHGAWCWYKLIPLLKQAGHTVTALDMAASGINMKRIEEVCTFEEYSQPLLDFMSSLSTEEKVILVGHSLGGMNIALAMEKYPQKISAAVFLTAFVPDTKHKPSYVVDKLAEALLQGGWLDSQFLTYGPPDEPLTAALLGHQLMQALYALSPVEDLELAMALRRPSSLFLESLAKLNNFSDNAYGSVKRVYIISKEDKGMTEAFARWMIENSGVSKVREIENADHMTMLSDPKKLCECLIEIADE